MARLVARQYDICKNLDRSSRAHIPYFVVLQADLLLGFATVIVAPVRSKRTTEVISRLNPVVKIEGELFFVTMQDMAGIPRKRLGTAVENVSGQHSEFVAAIDLIFTGV